MPKAVMATLESRAVTDLTHVEVDNVVNQQRMLKAVYAISGLLVIFSLYAIFSPKSIYDSTRRAFLADVARPDEYPARQHQARQRPRPFAGRRRRACDVFRSRRGHTACRRSSCITASIAASFSRSRIHPGRPDVRPLAGHPDQRPAEHGLLPDGRRRRIVALSPRSICPRRRSPSISVDLKFPDYTGVPPQMNVEGGNVEAIEGTAGHGSRQDQYAGEPGDPRHRQRR